MIYLSIVIPAYNEQNRLPESLPKVIRFVREVHFPVEVIIVDDGSQDKTAEVVREFQKEAPFISLLSLGHRGKGNAVREGMLKAQGEYLFLADSDLSMPIEEVKKFLPPALGEYDVAIASREIGGARRFNEPLYRHMIGRVFNMIVRMVAIRGLSDTQAGFKCFRRQAARTLFSQQTIDGWGFDVEILMIAQMRGMKIVEVPIHWYHNNDSRVRPLYDAYRMLSEVLRVRLNARRGFYDRPSEKTVPVLGVEKVVPLTGGEKPRSFHPNK
jgi:dolichyl-phosphate beta-glucosyltransferase